MSRDQVRLDSPLSYFLRHKISLCGFSYQQCPLMCNLIYLLFTVVTKTLSIIFWLNMYPSIVRRL